MRYTFSWKEYICSVWPALEFLAIFLSFLIFSLPYDEATFCLFSQFYWCIWNGHFFQSKSGSVLIPLPIMCDLKKVTLMVSSSCSCRGFNKFVLGKLSGSRINILYSISLLILLLISSKTMSNTSNHSMIPTSLSVKSFPIAVQISKQFIHSTNVDGASQALWRAQ